MIAHRATVFETNSVLWAQEHVQSRGKDVEVPPGFRAGWPARAQLAVAKLAAEIEATTSPNDFPGLLLKQAASSTDEDFIEVHIWGPMTRRTFERVVLRKATRKGRSQEQRNQEAKLTQAGVQVEFV
jgi:hypothetical protein